MSSSNSSLAASIADLKWSMVIFVQIWSIFLFAFGVVGHALNIYIFTRPKFRHNPCVRYFLASSLAGYAVVVLNTPLRWLQIAYNIDVFISSIPMYNILNYFSRVLHSWLIALASIDRFLCSSSSAGLRGWSNIRIASRASLFMVLFIALAYIHVPFYETILYPQRSCTHASSSYQAFYSLWHLIFLSWIPTLCMLVFGLLVVRHIRQGKMRISPQNQVPGNQKKTDQQLIQMLLLQSFILGSTTTAFSIGSLYISIMSSLIVKNDLEKAKDSYVINVLGSVSTTGPCMSFYIFTLSSELFRRELMNLFCCRRPLRIVSNTNTGIPLQIQN